MSYRYMSHKPTEIYRTLQTGGRRANQAAFAFMLMSRAELAVEKETFFLAAAVLLCAAAATPYAAE